MFLIKLSNIKESGGVINIASFSKMLEASFGEDLVKFCEAINYFCDEKDIENVCANESPWFIEQDMNLLKKVRIDILKASKKGLLNQNYQSFCSRFIPDVVNLADSIYDPLFTFEYFSEADGLIKTIYAGNPLFVECLDYSFKLIACSIGFDGLDGCEAIEFEVCSFVVADS